MRSLSFAIFLALWSALAAPALGPARDAEGEMFLSLLAGSSYRRTVLAPDGSVRVRTVMTVGAAEPAVGGGVEVALELSAPLGVEAVEPPVRSIWRCSGEEGSMLMSVLFLAEPGAAKRLTVSGDRVLYPRRGPAGVAPGRLPDLVLELEAERGFGSWLGARSVLRISERTMGASPGNAGGYVVSSAIDLRAFALGIRVKRMRLLSTEIVDQDGRLVSQQLERPNGERVLLERIVAKEGQGSGSGEARQ